MEFKELTTGLFKQNAIHSFNLISSGYHVGLLGTVNEAIILEMKNSSVTTHSFPYKVETVKLPTKVPCYDIINKFDLASIYANSDILKRQYISLDRVYVSELSEESIKAQAVVLAWAPKGLFKKCTLAIVSNTGVCEIRTKDKINREWNILTCNLTKLYYEIFPIPSPESVTTFEQLVEVIENLCTTSFSWNLDSNVQSNMFVTSNATGWLLLFMVIKGKPNYCGKLKTCLGRISYVYFIRNLIFACSSIGIIKVFKLHGTDISEVETLWAKADRLPCKQAHITFLKDLDQWIIVASKSSHALIFTLSATCVLLQKTTKYIGNIEITGLEKLSSFEYIFATITGSVKVLNLKIKQAGLEVNVADVKYEFDKTNYQLLGLVSSPNKVAWTFTLFHNKPYTHPSTFAAKDAIISVCNLNTKNAFTILKDELRPRENTLDCAEIVRLEILKYNISPKFENIFLDEFSMSKKFFRKLQIKFLILNAGLAFQHLKYNHVKKVVVNEISSLTKIIECVYINLRLQFLRRLTVCTPFQELSGKCMKYKLRSLHAETISDEDTFQNIYKMVNTLNGSLLMDLQSRFDTAEENCSYCNSPIDFSNMMCQNSHSVPRCAISYVQIPLFTKLFCYSCNRLYLEEIELLKSIVADDNEIQCSFCGFSLEIEEKETGT